MCMAGTSFMRGTRQSQKLSARRRSRAPRGRAPGRRGGPITGAIATQQYRSCPVLFDFHRQGFSFANKISILRNGSSHGRISLLPSDSHTPWWEPLLHLYSLYEAPSFLAFINGEIGPCLILCDPVK